MWNLSTRPLWMRGELSTSPCQSQSGPSVKAVMNELHMHITKVAQKGLTHLLPAGDSFYAVVFDTTKHRDKAISDLKRVTFKVEGAAVAITVLRLISGKVTAWTVTAGFGDTASNIADAVVGLITNHNWTSQSALKFTTFPVLKRGVYNGQFVVHFHSPPPWCGKQVTINGQTCLITSESPAAYRFYRRRDHSLVNYTESTDWILDKDKESLAKRIIPAASDSKWTRTWSKSKQKHKDRVASTSSNGKKTKLTDEGSGHQEEED